MTRIAGISGWQELVAVAVATPVATVYPTYSGGRWSFSATASAQMGTFTLRDSRLFLDPGVVAGGRVALLGSRRTVTFLALPASTTLSAYAPGAALSAARTGTAAYLGTS